MMPRYFFQVLNISSVPADRAGKSTTLVEKDNIKEFANRRDNGNMRSATALKK